MSGDVNRFRPVLEAFEDRTVPTVFVNELHYHDSGPDVGQFVELAGTAGTNLSGWSIVLDNGSSGAGTPYYTSALTGTLANQQNGSGTLAVTFPANTILDGPYDGLALVDNTGEVIQFLSYGGQFVATSGPAAGLTSQDIGVQESGTDPTGLSLQLTGTGNVASDFTWQGPAPASPGAINAGETFVAVSGTVVSVTNISDAIAGGTAGDFRFTRTGDVSAPLTVNYTVDGTAVPGSDYTGLPGTVTFAAGSATADVTVAALPDGTGPADVVQSVSVTVAPPQGASYSSDGVTAAIWVVTYSTPGVTVQELPSQSDDGPVERERITRVGSLSQPVTVAFAINPEGSTAVAGTDYSLQGSGLVFAPGTLSGTVTFAAGSAVADVDVVPDPVAVAPVQLALQPGTGYAVGAGATVPVNLNIAPPNSTIDFSGIRTDINYEITVSVTAPGGNFGILYTTKLGTVTVTVGESTADIVSDIDQLLEAKGYMSKPLKGSQLKVYSTKGAVISDQNLAFVNLTDKDGKPTKGVKPPFVASDNGVSVYMFSERLREVKPQ